MKRRVLAGIGIMALTLFVPTVGSFAGPADTCRAQGNLHWVHFDDAEDDEVVGVGYFDIHAVGICVGVLGNEVNAGVDPSDGGYGPNYLLVGVGVNCSGTTCNSPVNYTGGGFGRPGCYLGTTVLGTNNCYITQTRNLEVKPNPPEVDSGFNLVVPVVGPVALCVTVGGNCTN